MSSGNNFLFFDFVGKGDEEMLIYIRKFSRGRLSAVLGRRKVAADKEKS